jgi:hypothetical protein
MGLYFGRTPGDQTENRQSYFDYIAEPVEFVWENFGR